MNNILQVSAVQCRWDYPLERNKEVSIDYLRKAKDLGSNLVIFPEANITGYDFDYLVNLDSNEVEEVLKTICLECKHLSINAIVGSIIRRDNEDKFLNIAHVINSKGEISYEYAKIHLAGAETKYCSPGNKIALFEIEGILCAMGICRDGRHPELFTIPTMVGAKIFFQLSNSNDSLEKSWWKATAGRATQPIGPRSYIFHVVANAVGQDRRGDLITLGESFIKDPSGLSLAEANEFDETIITARLDITKATGRYPMDSKDYPEILRPLWQEMIKVMIKHKDDPVR